MAFYEKERNGDGSRWTKIGPFQSTSVGILRYVFLGPIGFYKCGETGYVLVGKFLKFQWDHRREEDR